MKNFLRITAMLLFIIGGISTAQSQNYKMAAGVRLGYPISASVKLFISETTAIEAFANYRSNKTQTAFGSYGWSWFGVGAAYQIHADIGAIDGLQWYYGGGVSVVFYNYDDSGYYDDYNNLSFGLQGNIGLDYKFDNVPINLSADWVPTYYLSGFVSGFGAGYGAFSVRYIISE